MRLHRRPPVVTADLDERDQIIIPYPQPNHPTTDPFPFHFSSERTFSCWSNPGPSIVTGSAWAIGNRNLGNKKLLLTTVYSRIG